MGTQFDGAHSEPCRINGTRNIRQALAPPCSVLHSRSGRLNAPLREERFGKILKRSSNSAARDIRDSWSPHIAWNGFTLRVQLVILTATAVMSSFGMASPRNSWTASKIASTMPRAG